MKKPVRFIYLDGNLLRSKLI